MNINYPFQNKDSEKNDSIKEYKSEIGEKILSLRKIKINNILFSKRKITNDEGILLKDKDEYVLKLEDIHISDSIKINISEFYKNVNNLINFNSI